MLNLYVHIVAAHLSLHDGEGTLRSQDNFVPKFLVPVSYLRKKYPVKPAHSRKNTVFGPGKYLSAL